MRLQFDVSRCIRATSKASTCRACVDATEGRVSIEEQLPTFAKGSGVESAACVGACPTEAFSLGSFHVTAFIFTMWESQECYIAKGESLPCLSLLSVEHLVALALGSEYTVTLNLYGYEPQSHLYRTIADRIEEANFLLSALGKKRLHVTDEQKEQRTEANDTALDRRGFLQKTTSLKGVVAQKQAFDDAVEADEPYTFEVADEMIEKIRQKILPDKRKLLYTVLKHSPKPESYEVLAQEDLSFISQKFIDEGCTNCQMCYRICPTGALSSNKKFSLIDFDAMLCMKCHLCHDVCEPEAIHLQPGFEVKELFEPTTRRLATFNVKRCNECGNPFTYFGGEQMCPRCLVEEDEAISLHANARAMNNG